MRKAVNSFCDGDSISPSACASSAFFLPGCLEAAIEACCRCGRLQAENQTNEDGIDLEFDFLAGSERLAIGGFRGGGDELVGLLVGGGKKFLSGLVEGFVVGDDRFRAVAVAWAGDKRAGVRHVSIAN